jgi:hypothetical protein
MLQRYDIAVNDQDSRLSIKEFAVLETKSRKRVNFNPTHENYSLVHEVAYDRAAILAAIKKGPQALIAVLRTGDFFPIYPNVEIIAERVTGMFNGSNEPVSEVFFDDRTLLSTYVAE